MTSSATRRIGFNAGSRRLPMHVPDLATTSSGSVASALVPTVSEGTRLAAGPALRARA
jgi:hypothetical protein